MVRMHRACKVDMPITPDRVQCVMGWIPGAVPGGLSVPLTKLMEIV